MWRKRSRSTKMSSISKNSMRAKATPSSNSGPHQFLAMFKVDKIQPDRIRHFGLMVRDEAQLGAVREKLTRKYGLELIPGFRCDFHDPFGNRIQVVDLHDESLAWLMPYAEVQKLGITFEEASGVGNENASGR